MSPEAARLIQEDAVLGAPDYRLRNLEARYADLTEQYRGAQTAADRAAALAERYDVSASLRMERANSFVEPAEDPTQVDWRAVGVAAALMTAICASVAVAGWPT